MPKRLLILVASLLLAVASCGGSGSDTADNGDAGQEVAVGPPDAANGTRVYETVCIVCHGPGGEGIDGLGKPMPGSEFIGSLSDAELIEFIKTGRGTDDPLSTTGVAMPPWGGNPDLTEQDLVDVVAFMRAL